MAKIKPMALVESMSGKVCGHSDVYFRTNKRNGNVSSGKMCYPSTAAPTTNQTAVRTKFASAIASAKAIIAATSSDSVQTNYTKKVAYQASYDANRTFGGTFFNFVMKKEYEALGQE